MGKETKDADLSSAASAMSKKRWASLTEDERKAAMEKARAARQRKLSKARRVEIARQAVNARWAKVRASKQTGESAESKGFQGPAHTRRRRSRNGGDMGRE
jgi:TRAP-type C4-dicarboxylate transport system substrate-binding protein